MITVLMSGYKWRDELPQAVESVLAQTFSDFEFLVGTNDQRVIRYFAENVKDLRVVVKVWQPDHTLPEALNCLLELAHGDYVALIHDDDYYLPTYLEALLADFEGDPKKYVFVSSGFICIDEDGSQKRSLGTLPLACLHQSVLYSRFYIDRLSERDGHAWDERWEIAFEMDFLFRMLTLGPGKHHNEWLYVYRTYTSFYRSWYRRFQHFIECVEAANKGGFHYSFPVLARNFLFMFMQWAHYAGITWKSLGLERVRKRVEQWDVSYKK